MSFARDQNQTRQCHGAPERSFDGGIGLAMLVVGVLFGGGFVLSNVGKLGQSEPPAAVGDHRGSAPIKTMQLEAKR